MANIYVPGPSPVAIGIAGGQLTFLGWTQGDVMITEELMTEPVMADYAGRRMPADMILEGKSATAEFRLVDFNQGALDIVFGRVAGGIPGAVQINEIGTLMRAEGRMLQFCVKANRQPLISAYANNLKGAWFPECFVQGPIRFPFGNAAQIIPVQIYTWAMIDKTGQNGAVLWTDDIPTFPATN